jgi:hypothetical protein
VVGCRVTVNQSSCRRPWMRGAPHNGFFLLIRWMRSRSSGLTGGPV